MTYTIKMSPDNDDDDGGYDNDGDVDAIAVIDDDFDNDHDDDMVFIRKQQYFTNSLHKRTVNSNVSLYLLYLSIRCINGYSVFKSQLH